MKDKLSKLFKTPDSKLGVSPFMLILLAVTIIGAGIYFFMSNRDDTAVAPPVAEEGTSFIDKIKETLSFGGDETTPVESNEPSLRPLPNIPPDSLQLDPTLAEEEVVEENTDFAMEEIDIEYVGRRDPMRSIVGEDVGTFDDKRINDEPSDLKDESKNYFGGMTVDDIVFDSIAIGEDDKLRGTFIVNGSVFNKLEEGDYLAEIYYVKEFNSKENYVIIQYQSNTYKLKAQNILNGNYQFSGDSQVDSDGSTKK